MKISTPLFFDRSTQMLTEVQGKLAKTQVQLSTGKEIVKPSDAPDKAALVIRLDSQISRQEGYLETLKAVNVRLTAEETALKNTSDVLYRIKELTLQGANDTLSKQDRQSVALEMRTVIICFLAAVPPNPLLPKMPMDKSSMWVTMRA